MRVAGRQATGRATLAPVERKKAGKTYWVARGQVPVRSADGTVGSRRVERGFGPGCETAAERHQACARWNEEYEERFRNPRRVVTFARAYHTYLSTGHKPPYYGNKFLPLLGPMQCADIEDDIMVDATEELWPEGAAPSTINRHLYTPVIAVLHMALKQHAPELTRPAGHRDVKPVIIPPDEWYGHLWPHLNPDQLALVMFLGMHGRRLGEALGRQPAHLDAERGLLDLGKTKTGVRQVELHPQCLSLIVGRPGWKHMDWLFSYGPNSKGSLHRDLRAACKRAKVAWYYPHSFGRHYSVTSMLRRGYSVAYVAEAHGMTPEMVTRRYGHLAKRETTAALHEVGGALFARAFNGGNVGNGSGQSSVLEVDKPSKSPYLLTKSGAEDLPIEPPSEGSALSSCATGAFEKPGK